MAKQQLTSGTSQATPALGAPSDTKRTRPVGLEVRLRPTSMNHIFFFDVEGDGRLREVAIVKAAKTQEGIVQSVYYIDIALLDNVDKGRLKGLVTGTHADKYELWDLMSQGTLNNGKNALDYFHQLVRTVHGPGATNTSLGGGLAGVKIESNTMVGAEFGDPAGASLEGQPG
jgi:hypothetical protein